MSKEILQNLHMTATFSANQSGGLQSSKRNIEAVREDAKTNRKIIT